MANAFSHVHNYDQPVYEPDFNLIQTALSYRQNAYDTNRSKIEMLLAKLPGIDLYKDVDKEYFKDRLQQTLTITNKYAGLDLSDNGLANSIINNVSQVFDENVENAAISTKLIRKEDEFMKEKMKAKDGSYSAGNHKYALQHSDRARYLTTNQVGDSYEGGFMYEDYVDTGKINIDMLPKIADMLKVKFHRTGQVGGFLYSEEGTEINQGKVKEALGLFIDQKYQRQLEIDAWNRLDQAPDEVVETLYDGHINSTIEENQDKLADIEVMKANPALTAEQERTIAQTENLIREKITALEGKKYKNMVGEVDRETLYTTAYVEQYKNSLANTISYDARVESSTAATAHNEYVKFDYQQKQDAIKNKREDAKTLAEINKKNAETDALNLKNLKAGKEEDPTVKIDIEKHVEDLPGGELLGVHNKERQDAFSGVKDILGAGFAYSDVTKSIQQINQGNKTVKIRGKEIKVTPEVVEAFTTFDRKILNDDPTEKAVINWGKTVAEQTTNSLSNSVSQSLSVKGVMDRAASQRGFDPYHLPKFDYKYNDKMQWVPLTPDEKKNTHNFVKLLKMKGDGKELSKSQEATLLAYTTTYLKSSDKISPERRKVLERATNTTLREIGVPIKETQKAANTRGLAKASMSTRFDSTTNTIIALTNHFSNFEDADELEDTLIPNIIEESDKNLDIALKGFKDEKESTTYSSPIFTSKNPDKVKIDRIIASENSAHVANDKEITILPVFGKEFNRTGVFDEVDIRYYNPEEKKYGEIRVPYEKLQQQGINLTQIQKKSPYSMSHYGGNASKVKLGYHVLDLQDPNNSLRQNYEQVSHLLKQYPDLKPYYNIYQKEGINFTMVPDEEKATYVVELRDKNNRLLGSAVQNLQNMDPSDAAAMTAAGKQLSSEAFLDFLKQQAEGLRARQIIESDNEYIINNPL